VPVLARLIERAGIPTVVVTMMPDTATGLLAPRTLGVEFPFGHAFGLPNDPHLQRRVLESALVVLAGAQAPGTRIDFDYEWPIPVREAYHAWQPPEPSPAVALMLRRNQQQAAQPTEP
jgi:hypothetical protein